MIISKLFKNKEIRSTLVWESERISALSNALETHNLKILIEVNPQGKPKVNFTSVIFDKSKHLMLTLKMNIIRNQTFVSFYRKEKGRILETGWSVKIL